MQYYTNDFYNNSKNIQTTLKYNYYFTLLDIRKFIENLNIQKYTRCTKISKFA